MPVCVGQMLAATSAAGTVVYEQTKLIIPIKVVREARIRGGKGGGQVHHDHDAPGRVPAAGLATSHWQKEAEVSAVAKRNSNAFV